MDEKSSSKFDTISGYGAGVVLIFAISLSSASVQDLKGTVPDFELTTCRFLMQVFTFTTAGMIIGATFRINREHVPAMLWYSVLCTLYNIGFYGASTYLPLLEVAGILKVVDMITALLQARILFNQEIGKVYGISLVVCSLSILLVVQPPWIFKPTHVTNGECVYLKSNSSCTWVDNWNSTLDNASDNVWNSTKNNFWNNTKNSMETAIVADSKQTWRPKPRGVHNTAVGYTLILIGGIANGLMYDVISVMLRDVTPVVKASYMSLGGIVTSAVVALYTETLVFRLSAKHYGLVLAHCFFAVFSAFSKIYMAHKIGGVRASITQCLLIMVMLLFQYTLMKSVMPGHRNWFEVAGALILTLGSLVPPLFDFIKHKRGSTSLP